MYETEIDNSIPQLKIEPQPFCINFCWESKSVTVSLANGEEILLLAKLFAKMLGDAGIEHTVEESE